MGDLINNGICFIAYENPKIISFYPSRFVGYFKNNINAHKRTKIDGQYTTQAISYILGYDPIEDDELDYSLEKYSNSLGIMGNIKGSFGKKRKYWFVWKNKKLALKFEELKQEEYKKLQKRKIIIPINENFKSWSFDIDSSTEKIIKGKYKVPNLDNISIEINGEKTSFIIGSFEWDRTTNYLKVRTMVWKLLKKHQKFILMKNIELKLRDFIYSYSLSIRSDYKKHALQPSPSASWRMSIKYSELIELFFRCNLFM